MLIWSTVIGAEYKHGSWCYAYRVYLTIQTFLGLAWLSTTISVIQETIHAYIDQKKSLCSDEEKKMVIEAGWLDPGRRHNKISVRIQFIHTETNLLGLASKSTTFE